MKLKEGFVLRKVAGNFVVFPVGETTVDFSGMLALNETGALLWEKLSEGAQKSQLCDALCTEYEISYDTAIADVDAFIKKLADAGYIEL
ncbi:MAG: PqqD family protein [Ruminococcaceae bacterium]|nr:PqqD family protein [Oscillospiraceae bacterium]